MVPKFEYIYTLVSHSCENSFVFKHDYEAKDVFFKEMMTILKFTDKFRQKHPPSTVCCNIWKVLMSTIALRREIIVYNNEKRENYNKQ